MKNTLTKIIIIGGFMKKVTRSDFTKSLKKMAKAHQLNTKPIDRMVDRLVEFWGDNPTDKTPEELIMLLFYQDLWKEFLSTFSERAQAILNDDPEGVIQLQDMPLIERLVKKGYLDLDYPYPNTTIKNIIQKWQIVIRHPRIPWYKRLYWALIKFVKSIKKGN